MKLKVQKLKVQQFSIFAFSLLIFGLIFCVGCSNAIEETISDTAKSDNSITTKQLIEAKLSSKVTSSQNNKLNVISNFNAAKSEAKKNTAILPSNIDMSNVVPLEEECCTDIGKEDECWMTDAQDDGATCTSSNTDNCAAGETCTIEGLCTCTNPEDCNDGICTEAGVCGPSYCNGFKICDCWGGCTWWDEDLDWTPAKEVATQSLYCCEGTYPEGTIPLVAYYSTDPNCGEGCTLDIECSYLNDACIEGKCMSGTCVPQPEPAGTVCVNNNQFAYPSDDYPDSCYNFFCGQHDGTDPIGPAGPATGVANGVCQPAFDIDNLELNDTCAAAISLGSFVASASDGAILQVVDADNLCATNTYQAGGDDCDSLGDNGSDLVYSFTYETNTHDNQQLRGYMVQLESNFDAVVYVSEDCPSSGASPIKVTSNRCLLPYESATNSWEQETNIFGNGLIPSGSPLHQQCCNPADSNCYKWCERGASWVYPDAPVPCNDATSGANIGKTTCNTYATDSSQTKISSTVIHPVGRTYDEDNPTANPETRTVYIFVDSLNDETGEFTLTVEHQYWNASPVERINDDPRVYDLTNVTDGKVYLGSLENAANSQHNATGNCGGYECTIAPIWAGKSTGELGSSCHNSGSANEFWPNSDLFKFHKQNGTTVDSDGYCITLEKGAGADDLVLDVLKRNAVGPGNTITPITSSRYDDAINCKNTTVYGGKAQINIAGTAQTLYLIGVSSYSETSVPCLGNCDYKLTVTDGVCPEKTAFFPERYCAMPAAGLPATCKEGSNNSLKAVGEFQVGGAAGSASAVGQIIPSDNNCVANGRLGSCWGSSFEEAWLLIKNPGDTFANLTITVTSTDSPSPVFFKAYGCDGNSKPGTNQIGTSTLVITNYITPLGNATDWPMYIVVDGDCNTTIYNYQINVSWN